MPFYRKLDVPGEAYEWTETVVDLIEIAERIAASRTLKPAVVLRIGTERTMVYVGSLN